MRVAAAWTYMLFLPVGAFYSLSSVSLGTQPPRESPRAEIAANQSAGPSQQKTFMWLKRLDGEVYREPRFGQLETVEDLKRIKGISFGGHAKEGAHVSFEASDFKHLRNFPSLRHLVLIEAEFTDEALVEIGRLKGLTHLLLGDAIVTDAGMKHLSGLKQLTHLGLAYPAGWNKPPPKITNAALVAISELQTIEYLDLNGTQVSDEGLKHLIKLPRLREIRLNDTPITDEGLKTLVRVKSLKTVLVKSGRVTKVTQPGIKEFRRLRPNCIISARGAPYPGAFPHGVWLSLDLD